MDNRLAKRVKYGMLLLYFGVCMQGMAWTSTRTITDMAGRKIQIPSKVEKVFVDRFGSILLFALDPSLAINYTFKLTTEAQKFISEEYAHNKIYTEGSAEEMIKLKPDINLICGEIDASLIEKANRVQAQTHIPTVIIEASVFKYIQTFAFLGDILNRKEAAVQLIKYFKTYLLPIQKAVSSISESQRPAVYYAEGSNGYHTDPSGSIHAQVLDFLKVRNVAKVKGGELHGLVQVSPEQVLVWNPQIILVWTGIPLVNDAPSGFSAPVSQTCHFIQTDPVWANVSAVKNHKIYQIPSLPFGWFDRPPSTNCLLGILWTASVVYPSCVNFDLATAIQNYYLLFYHANVSETAVRSLISLKQL